MAALTLSNHANFVSYTSYNRITMIFQAFRTNCCRQLRAHGLHQGTMPVAWWMSLRAGVRLRCVKLRALEEQQSSNKRKKVASMR